MKNIPLLLLFLFISCSSDGDKSNADVKTQAKITLKYSDGSLAQIDSKSNLAIGVIK